MASTFMTDIDDDSRTKVLKGMDLFLEILSPAIKFHACRIPQPRRVFLFSASKWQVIGMKLMGVIVACEILAPPLAV